MFNVQMSHDVKEISTWNYALVYETEFLIIGIDLIEIIFSYNRNLHMEQCSRVNSSFKESKYKAE